MNIFKDRVISLTSKKIELSSEYIELKRALDTTSFSDRSRTQLAKRLNRKREEMEHLEQSLKVNIYLSNRELQ